MAHQNKTVKIHPNGNGTSTMRLGGPTVVTFYRVSSPTQGKTDQSELHICNSFCGPLQTSHLCIPTYQPYVGKDIKEKTRFWGIHSKSRSDNQILSHGKRTILQQRLHQFSERTRTNNLLMWSQWPLSEHNSRKEDQGPTRARNKADTACQIKMDILNRAEHVDLRSTKRKWDQE